MTGDFMHKGDHAPVDSQPSPDPVAQTDGPDSHIEACWGRVNQRMRRDIGDVAWRNWIKPLRYGQTCGMTSLLRLTEPVIIILLRNGLLGTFRSKSVSMRLFKMQLLTMLSFDIRQTSQLWATLTTYLTMA